MEDFLEEPHSSLSIICWANNSKGAEETLSRKEQA